jgi:hypothetical protein
MPLPIKKRGIASSVSALPSKFNKSGTKDVGQAGFAQCRNQAIALKMRSGRILIQKLSERMNQLQLVLP